jgi:tellurite resistance protein TehA-like permease
MKVLPRFPPTSFAIPFGFAGLASVWRQMADFYGTPGAVSDVLFIAAAVCWSLLAVAAAGSRVCRVLRGHDLVRRVDHRRVDHHGT